MSAHEQFRFLTALSTAHSLTDDEQRILSAHLSVCEECRQLAGEYEAVVSTVVPALVSDFPVNTEVPPGWSVKAAKRELFRRLEEREQSISPHAAHLMTQRFSLGRPQWLGWAINTRSLLPYAASLAVILAVGIVGYHLGTRQVSMSPPLSTLAPSGDVRRLEITPDAEEPRLQAVLEQQDRTFASLKARIDRQSAEIQQLKADSQNLQGSFQEAEDRNAQTTSQRDELNRKLEQAQADLADMQKDLDSLHQQRAEQSLHAADLQAQVGKFPEMLKERDATIKEQRELLARDQDIRDLIGARQMYVAEVMDVGSNAETKKPFGRVFYTKGKSLIFYAYDLDRQPHAHETSTFQVWGRRGPDLSRAMNLGILSEDNPAHKRWLLKFDDTKSLEQEQVDAVFVTVEPQGGSRKPTSKEFLFTFLQATPNHP